MFCTGSKLCCIITGASRGFGASLAVDIARHSSTTCSSVEMVLTARSLAGLEKTKSSIGELNPSAKVHCVSANLSDIQSLASSVKSILEKVEPKEFTHVLLVNNAATLGDVSKQVRDFDDPQAIQELFGLNITAPMFLVSKFLNSFECVPKKYIVNISSLCALQEGVNSGLSQYCTSKAAGDMLFKVVAKEEPSTRVLNYAPGPLETDMARDLMDKSISPDIKNMTLMKPEVSSAKLLNLLLKDEFASGRHIDFFDC